MPKIHLDIEARRVRTRHKKDPRWENHFALPITTVDPKEVHPWVACENLKGRIFLIFSNDTNNNNMRISQAEDGLFTPLRSRVRPHQGHKVS